MLAHMNFLPYENNLKGNILVEKKSVEWVNVSPGSTMNATTFVYGSELQGRGYSTRTDLIFGCLTTAISLTALFGAVINLYLIKKLKAFHNAFGFFWAVRTVGELGSDTVFGFYTGPVTILQPASNPPTLGIFAYQLSFTFSYVQCVMNFVIALNRFVAVCYPLRYKAIFNKKLCVFVAVFIVLQALFSSPATTSAMGRVSILTSSSNARPTWTEITHSSLVISTALASASPALEPGSSTSRPSAK
uniref:7TM_GPCR_Srx domain-containing protein n=1 Tax=Steinernema glaseri TaxID=37863 RepID=A0A1I7YEJ3_9BILA